MSEIQPPDTGQRTTGCETPHCGASPVYELVASWSPVHWMRFDLCQVHVALMLEVLVDGRYNRRPPATLSIFGPIDTSEEPTYSEAGYGG